MGTGHLAEVFLLGAGLAMDAFSVCVALGVAEKKRFNFRSMLFPALLFGAFQFLMPPAGFFGGMLCGGILRRYGKWIAALLLGAIGAKMIYDRKKPESVSCSAAALFLLAVATSIDAFLVGIGFFCIGNPTLWRDAAIIGIVTAAISFAGTIAGKCGAKKLTPERAMILGGSVLMLLAVKNLF